MVEAETEPSSYIEHWEAAGQATAGLWQLGRAERSALGTGFAGLQMAAHPAAAGQEARPEKQEHNSLRCGPRHSRGVAEGVYGQAHLHHVPNAASNSPFQQSSLVQMAHQQGTAAQEEVPKALGQRRRAAGKRRSVAVQPGDTALQHAACAQQSTAIFQETWAKVRAAP